MMWNIDVWFQIRGYLMFLVLGLLTALFYDFFKAARIVRDCSFIEIFFQDIIFWTVVTFADFFACVAFLGGEIRLFAVMAQITGIAVFSHFCSSKAVYCIAVVFGFFHKIKRALSEITYRLCLKTDEATENLKKFLKKQIKKIKFRQKTLEKT